MWFLKKHRIKREKEATRLKAPMVKKVNRANRALDSLNETLDNGITLHILKATKHER